MLRKIMEVCKKHWLIILDILLTIASVVFAYVYKLDVRMFLILPAICIFCDVYVILLNKKRVWRYLLVFAFGVTLSLLMQSLR